MKKYYYHITDVENIESIMANGLRANEDGDIFLFENKSVGYHGISYNSRGKLAIGKVRRTIADNIAINQLGLMEKYAMFEISSEGISGSLINDNVAEASSKWQWIAHQPTILAKYISIFGIYDVEPYGEMIEEMRELTEEELKQLGLHEEQSE